MSAPAIRSVVAVSISQRTPLLFSSPHEGSSAAGALASLAFQDSRPDVRHQRHLGHAVVLPERRDLEPLHHRVRVLEPVTQRARSGVHEDLVDVHAQVGEQDVQLLGQVDVDGGLRCDRSACNRARPPRASCSCPRWPGPERTFLPSVATATAFMTSPSFSTSSVP